MGREIRRVPPHWEHPRYTADDAPTERCIGEHRQLYDEPYIPALERWIEAHRKWESGKDKGRADSGMRFYAEYNGNPPDVAMYRPDWGDTATWYQVYQTVGEGSPVTPPFATQDELIDYLATHGDFWDQQRGNRPWSRANAERFVKSTGHAPSLVVSNGRVMDGHEYNPEKKDAT